MNILDLNEHSLLLIFEFCSLADLENLYLTCKRFLDIIKRFERYLLRKKCLDLLLTGCRNNGNQRTLHDLTYIKRINLSNNWRYGKYEERTYFRHILMYSSQILLEKDLFYISHLGQLRIHRRLKSRQMVEEHAHEVIGNSRSGDITSFVKEDNTIFAGRDNGHAFIYENGEYFQERISDYIGERRAYINAVDIHRDAFVTASMTSMKIWRKIYELDMVSLEQMIENNGIYKCLKLSPDGNQCAAGKYSDESKRALRLIDMETNEERALNSQTRSVYSLLWKDYNTVLTANYDSTLRLIDIRSNTEQSWMDPYDSSIYSLAYDGLYGVLCGVMHHCRVNLYDLRMSKKFVQLYFSSLQNSGGSPAYSIACDSSQLFIATDRNLRIMNFDSNRARPRDYYHIFNFGM